MVISNPLGPSEQVLGENSAVEHRLEPQLVVLRAAAAAAGLDLRVRESVNS